MCYRMKSLVVVTVFVSACVLVLGLSPASADLMNGSFEQPELPTNGYITDIATYWYPSNFHGWVINGNNASGDGMYAPSDGNQFQEFTGWMGQNTAIPLVPGNTYTVSFDVNPGTFSGLSTTVHLEAEPDATTPSGGDIFGDQTFSEFAASTWTPETLSAKYTGDPGKYLGAWFMMSGSSVFGGLDHVVVTSTPEPSAAILLASGMIGLLAYTWRKRR
jgi:hypothetical protein